MMMKFFAFKMMLQTTMMEMLLSAQNDGPKQQQQ